MNTYQEVLAHFGVKGMKWGVRRSRTSSSSSTKTPPGHISEDARKAHDAHVTVQKHKSTDPLSNQELRHLVERIDLEHRYTTSLGKAHQTKGKKFVTDILANVGKQTATKLASDAAAKTVASALKK